MKSKYYVLIILTTSMLFILYAYMSENPSELANSSNIQKSEMKYELADTPPNEMNIFRDSALIPLPAAECKNYLHEFNVDKTWQQDNKNRLKELLTSFITKGLTGEELDHVAFITEITPSNAKGLIGLYNLTDSSLPMISGVKGSSLSEEYMSRVYGYLLDNKIDDIIELVKQGVITGDTYIISENGQYSLISVLLMSDISLEDKYEAIDKLLNLDVSVTYQDLMVASHINMPTYFIDKLWLASELNASFVLPFGASEKSLAQIALENENVELLDFWLTQGSASVIEPFQSTLLDLLPSAIFESEKELKTELLLTLVKHNISANNKNTQYKLKAWLDDEYYKQYKSTFEQTDLMSTKIANRPQVVAAITDIFFNVLQPLIKSRDSLKVQHPCFRPEALRVINSVFQLKTKYVNVIAKSTVETIEQGLYTETELLAMDVKEATSILGMDKSLAAKQAIVNLSLKRIKQNLTSSNNIEYTAEELEGQQKNIDLVELAYNGKWKKVINALNENKYPSQAIDFVMVYAVDKKQSIDLILKLHSFGGTFSAVFMHAVVKRNDLSIAKILVNHGLDFHQSNNLGANAIYTAVSHKKLNMLRYLIDEGVEVKPYEFGFDPLDIALQNLRFDSSTLSFVSILIETDTPIELSHKEITLEFSLSNLDLYFQLISQFPMLKSTIPT